MDYDAHAQKVYDTAIGIHSCSGMDLYGKPQKEMELLALVVEAVFEVAKDIQRIANALEAK